MRLFKGRGSRSAERTRRQPGEGTRTPKDRRAPHQYCANCHVTTVPLVFLENGRAYCAKCEPRVQDLTSMRTAGRRSSDLRTTEDRR